MTDAGPPTAEIYLHAPGNPGQHAPLADFIEACAALRKTLRHVERCITGKEPGLEFEVTAATVASMRLATAPNTRNPDVFKRAHETVRVHRETCAKLQNRRSDLDPRLDYDGIKSFDDFSRTVRRGKVEIEVDGIALSNDFVETLSKVLRPIQPAYGSVSGRVEKLDVHGKYTFVLFPPRAGVEVLCSFHPDKIDAVLSAVKGHVTVTVFGLLQYGRGCAFPISADIDDIEVHPRDDELPSLLDMRGMMEGDAAAVTGKLDDEWQ